MRWKNRDYEMKKCIGGTSKINGVLVELVVGNRKVFGLDLFVFGTVARVLVGAKERECNVKEAFLR